MTKDCLLKNFLFSREHGKSLTKSTGRSLSKRFEAWLEEKATKGVLAKECYLEGDPKAIFIIEISHDGRQMALLNRDHTVRIVEVASGRVVQILKGHPRSPWTAEFHKSHPNIIATCCLAGQVRIWDLLSGSCDMWESPGESHVPSIALHPTAKILLIACAHKVLLWNWEVSMEPQLFASSKRTCENVRWVKFDNTGDMFYTGTKTNTEYNLHNLRQTPAILEANQRIGLISQTAGRSRNHYQSSLNADISLGEVLGNPLEISNDLLAQQGDGGGIPDVYHAATTYSQLHQIHTSENGLHEPYEQGAGNLSYSPRRMTQRHSLPQPHNPADLSNSSSTFSRTESNQGNRLHENTHSSASIVSEELSYAASESNSNASHLLPKDQAESSLCKKGELSTSQCKYSANLDKLSKTSGYGGLFNSQGEFTLRDGKLSSNEGRLCDSKDGLSANKDRICKRDNGLSSSDMASSSKKIKLSNTDGILYNKEGGPSHSKDELSNKKGMLYNNEAGPSHSKDELSRSDLETSNSTENSSDKTKKSPTQLNLSSSLSEPSTSLSQLSQPSECSSIKPGPSTNSASSGASAFGVSLQAGLLSARPLPTHHTKARRLATARPAIRRPQNNLAFFEPNVAVQMAQQAEQQDLIALEGGAWSDVLKIVSCLEGPQGPRLFSNGIMDLLARLETLCQHAESASNGIHNQMPSRTSLLRNLYDAVIQAHHRSQHSESVAARIQAILTKLRDLCRMEEALSSGAAFLTGTDTDSRTGDSNSESRLRQSRSVGVSTLDAAGNGDFSAVLIGHARPERLRLRLNYAQGGPPDVIRKHVDAASQRIQRWRLDDEVANLDDCGNVILHRCRIHNDAAIDISQDGSILAVFVKNPTTAHCPGVSRSDSMLRLVSLREDSLGDVLHQEALGKQPVAVSISPLNGYVAVGFVDGYHSSDSRDRAMLRYDIYKVPQTRGLRLKTVKSVATMLSNETRVMVNCLKWLPMPGQGLVVGTNNGKAVIYHTMSTDKSNHNTGAARLIDLAEFR